MINLKLKAKINYVVFSTIPRKFLQKLSLSLSFSRRKSESKHIPVHLYGAVVFVYLMYDIAEKSDSTRANAYQHVIASSYIEINTGAASA